MLNLSPDILQKVLTDSYEGTILELIDDSIQRIQSSTDNREYVEKQSKFIATCVSELKRRRTL